MGAGVAIPAYVRQGDRLGSKLRPTLTCLPPILPLHVPRFSKGREGITNTASRTEKGVFSPECTRKFHVRMVPEMNGTLTWSFHEDMTSHPLPIHLRVVDLYLWLTQGAGPRVRRARPEQSSPPHSPVFCPVAWRYYAGSTGLLVFCEAGRAGQLSGKHTVRFCRIWSSIWHRNVLYCS